MKAGRILVTGGAGFIGSAFVRRLLAARPEAAVLSLDALTYAGHEANLADLPGGDRHALRRGDVASEQDVEAAFEAFRPEAVVHLAAETHVDRSILDPAPFVRTNVLGTQVLLEACRTSGIRLVVVSTDEVYGSLEAPYRADPGDPLRPGNAYAASKAAGDLLAQAAFRTHGQDVLITRCTNNYGPRQMPEKLIPLMILRARDGSSLPVYGDGLQVRDWLHVEDSADGVLAALERGESGALHHFGGAGGQTNLDVVRAICEAVGADTGLIEHVRDRPGHDRRYALDDAATRAALDWEPRISFADGLARTVRWYLENPAWCEAVSGRELSAFVQANYGDRTSD